MSLACFLLTALLGPSVFEPSLAGKSGQPPYSLHVHPSPYLVVGLVVVGALLGTAGLGLCFAAVRRGWQVRAWLLVVAGLLAAAAFTFMPPIGSADHLNYASYGRMAATGHDPYATRAVDVPGDPVIGSPEEWRTTPSVYGPIATAEQAFASWIGGDSLRLTVFALSVLNTLAFAATALILYRAARSEERRLRTALLWTCNPLVLFHLAGGAHNDVLAIAPMVAAVAVFPAWGTPRPGRRGWLRTLASGALIGAGAAIKLPAALVGGGPAWVLLRRMFPERTGERASGGRRAMRGVIAPADTASFWGLAALAGGAAGVAATAFALGGPHAFDQVGNASDMVSLATPWHLVDLLLGPGGQRPIIKIGWVLLMLGLLWILVRVLPPGDGTSHGEEHRRIAAALVLAWLLAAPYELPWYDGFGWAMLALLPWTRVDWILLAHTGALSLAYLPARAPERIGMPDGLSWLFTVVRPVVIPLVLTAVLVALAVLWRRRGRVPGSEGPPREPAGSPE